ncbi:MAG: hypothetical protein HZA17_04080 [Nitrospirae bacterium]|nr:hypothetical protein [Nitrospirota bacterium]
MNLFHNPFFIIGVSTRDSKQSIVDACDAKSLTVDSGLCTRSRAILTQPRNRLSAELAWLPGYSPVGAKVLVEKIQKEPAAFLSSLDGIAPLPRCNALVTFLEHHKPNTESQITGLLIDVAQSFERIDYPKLMAAINEDRQIAKIPAVQDVENIKQEMQARREYMVGTMKNCLNNIKDPDRVLTEIVAKTTSEGKQHPPMLVEELTDKYQIEVQKYLDQLVGQIRSVMERIQEQPKQSFEYQMPTLYKYLKTWDQIAQPIQIIHQSKGMDDPHSKKLAQDLRGLAVEIANSDEMYSEAKQIIKIIAEVFKKLPQFAEKVSEDLAKLDDIIKRKPQSKGVEDQSMADCFLDIEFGTIFKKRLTISPAVIRFNKAQIPPNEVTKLRWGEAVIKRSISFIPIGTTHSFFISIGDNKSLMYIRPSERNLYNMIVDRLWKVVCGRMLEEALTSLSIGKKLVYGDAVVEQSGMVLKKYTLSGWDPFFCKWADLFIENVADGFVVQSKTEDATSITVFYSDTDNAHILECVIRLFCEGSSHHQKLRESALFGSSDFNNEEKKDVLQNTEMIKKGKIVALLGNNIVMVSCPKCKDTMKVSLKIASKESKIVCANCSQQFYLPK